MRKISLILTVLSIILIISGCNGQYGGAPSSGSSNYRTGTQGLVLSLVSPPSKLYEGSRDTPITIQVDNKGAFPQPDELGSFDGILWIGGYDEDILRISPSNGIDLDAEELEGKSQYNSDGSSTFVSFEIDVKDFPEGTAVYRPNLLFTSTYKYKTIASTEICVDPEPRTMEVREKICTPRESFSAGTQGGPVTISNVEQHTTGEYIQFKIKVQNSGTGKIIPLNKINTNPDEGYDIRDLDVIDVEDARVGKDRLDCRPNNELKLINNIGYLYCKLSTSGISQVYTTPLTVELEYGYTSSINKQIEVIEEIDY